MAGLEVVLLLIRGRWRQGRQVRCVCAGRRRVPRYVAHANDGTREDLMEAARDSLRVVDGEGEPVAHVENSTCAAEAQRIEHKFSWVSTETMAVDTACWGLQPAQTCGS